MSSGTPFIRLQSITKSYGGQTVLDIDEFSMYPRESIVLIGRNASGKSTLLRILAGISTVDGGRISHHPVLRKRRLGYLPQAGGLYGDLTLADNLGLRRRLFKLPEVSLRKLWYIEELGLGPFLGKSVSQLSGGFSRLAAIAATLHGEPHWLLLDEPLSGVDGDAQKVLKHFFKGVKKKSDLCVITTPTEDLNLGVKNHIEVKKGRII